MQILSLVWGILAILGMGVAFIPCLGSLNWLNIPFAGFGALISAIAYSDSNSPNRSAAFTGLILCCIAIFLGIIRLVAGCGIF
jgi:hypothetical protein